MTSKLRAEISQVGVDGAKHAIKNASLEFHQIVTHRKKKNEGALLFADGQAL